MKKQTIIVIGSGLGGLSAAIRLAAQGHDVTLFEKRDKLGGRAYQYEIDGFKFDGGPTVITAPWMIDELWQLAGKRREDEVEIVKVDPFYRIFDHQGRYLDYNGDHEFILSQIEKFNPADKEGYSRFIASTKAVFDRGMGLIDTPFLQPLRHAQGGARSDPAAILPQRLRLRLAIHQGRLPAPLLLLPPAADRRQPADRLGASTC